MVGGVCLISSVWNGNQWKNKWNLTCKRERIVKYMDKEKCVNCGISGVPLHLGMDGQLHCDNCGGLLISDKQNVIKNQEEQEHEKN